MSEPIVDKMFSALYSYQTMEAVIVDHFDDIFRDATWGHATFDSYDYSFELFEFLPFEMEITDAQLHAIWALGFHRFWLHKQQRKVHGCSRKDNERGFCKGEKEEREKG